MARTTAPSVLICSEEVFMMMKNFLTGGRSGDKRPAKYDAEKLTPVIRCSICTGEKVAGFRDNSTGKFTDVMLLKSPRDLEAFRKKYGVEGEIENIY